MDTYVRFLGEHLSRSRRPVRMRCTVHEGRTLQQHTMCSTSLGQRTETLVPHLVRDLGHVTVSLQFVDGLEKHTNSL